VDVPIAPTRAPLASPPFFAAKTQQTVERNRRLGSDGDRDRLIHGGWAGSFSGWP
jgi:hypothetical protein